jgi:hypothetical protein
MKLKITEILETKKPWSAQGKNYTVYQWTINGQLKEENGNVTEIQNETIKTLSPWVKEQVKINSVWNVRVETYKGYTSFKITDMKPKEEKSYQKKVSIDKFDMLVNHCWELSNLEPGAVNEKAINMHTRANIFDKILGCASVMVDVDSLGGDIDKKIDDVNNKLDEVVEDIPF